MAIRKEQPVRQKREPREDSEPRTTREDFFALLRRIKKSPPRPNGKGPQ